MRILNAKTIHSLVKVPEMVNALERAFREECRVPSRQIFAMPGREAGRLLLSMQAFDERGQGMVKLVTLLPDNHLRGWPTIQGVIVLFTKTGTPSAVLDGGAVTKLRTAASSALASKYLSREDSNHLVVIGTGALAPYMALAHRAVRPIQQISVWGRRPDRAEVTAAAIRSTVNPGTSVVVPELLDLAITSADIVSCATSSAIPVLAGKWLNPGTFVDLVGSFSPSKRESDDEVVRRSRIFVDTREGALAEAGDLLDPIARGVISEAKIEGELSDLVRGRVKGRVSEREIILFKSVGTAIEDLAAAQLIVAAADKVS
jgi:alanine dehydrogenase